MYKVYIDSSKRREKSISIVKIENGKEEKVDQIIGDIELVSSLQELLNKNNLEVSDIAEVIPFLGPGSFTGLKLGVTVANVINWVNGSREIKELQKPDYGAEPNIQPKDF